MIRRSPRSASRLLVLVLAAGCSSKPGDLDAGLRDAGGIDAPIDAIVYDDGEVPDAEWADASPFCGNMTLDTGEVCDDGNTDDGDGCSRDCHSLEVCGDGYRNPGEICDSAGIDTATCDSDCTVPMCNDGHTNHAFGEDCDTMADAPTCDSDCTFPVCGDGHINPAFGEECESTVDTFVCDSDCTARMCGDGHVNMVGGEMCDSGDPAGSATCDPDCTPVLCGDGVTNTVAGEECDTAGDTSFCDGDCTMVLCGDGYTNPATEVCDDGNFSSCGSCNAGCTAPVSLSTATGTIICVPADVIADGDTLTIADGVHTPTVFEFDTVTPGVGAGHVAIVIAAGGGPQPVCTSIRSAINGVGTSLAITVPPGGTDIINLVNDQAGGFGNQPMDETIVDPSFAAIGMFGGAGADCPAGSTCEGAMVCAPPWDCVGGICM